MLFLSADPGKLFRCQAAFREREEKLYQYHTRYTCPYRLKLLPFPNINIGLFNVHNEFVLRGRSDDKLNPGNRLQQRWDPELECSRLQKLFSKVFFVETT